MSEIQLNVSLSVHATSSNRGTGILISFDPSSTFNKKYLKWFGIEIQALQADAQRKISFEGKTDNREWLKIIFKFWFSAVYLWSPVFALFDIQIVVQYSACISDNTWKYFKHLIYLTLSCKLWLGQDYYPILVVNIDS